MTLYLSNAAKGLFHGAIAQSGVLNMPMLYEIEPTINQLRQVCQTKIYFYYENRITRIYLLIRGLLQTVADLT